MKKEEKEITNIIWDRTKWNSKEYWKVIARNTREKIRKEL